jgi:murein DD-endopeptidase MepM/ murein hydrolase activator NlpD
LEKDLFIAQTFYPQKEQKTFVDQEELNVVNTSQVNIQENSFKQMVSTDLYRARTLAAIDQQPGQRREIIEYVVKKGDTLSTIADKFGISLETVLWANDLTKYSKIRPGQKLTILPVSGIMHLIGRGETLSGLARKYKVGVDDIVSFNGLSDEDDIFIGDLLVIPGGRMPKRTVVRYAPLARSYFICPISKPCRLTQNLHWYNAVDLSNGRCGEPVFAAAGGKVQRAGYARLPGYYVKLIHPNNITTFYGHFSKVIVSPGQPVSQGQIIGYSGQTGYATGCHVHFEVRGARNPFAR